MSKTKKDDSTGERHLSPVEVQKSLHGVDYPASRQELIDHAENEGAHKEVMEFLQSLPEGDYTSPVDVMKHFGSGKEQAAS